MKLKRTYLILALLLALVMAIAIPVGAASSVTESDWLQETPNPLVKCKGGDCDHTSCDYVYSFAVVGDTQNLNYTDAINFTAAKKENPSLTYADFTAAHMRTLYNWILDKKDALNIQYVMGVGDITQSFNTSQTYYNAEWPLAKEAISLLDGKLGYSLVRGNHDISSGLNSQFGVGTAYYNDLIAISKTTDAEGRPMGGFREATKTEDSYRKIVAGGNKYIIFTLEYYPTEETLTWMNELLSANYDYTAIVTLHCFVNRDTTFVDTHETTLPSMDAAKENWAQTATGGHVPPRQLWEKVLSKHANVQMVISGHIDEDNVLVNSMQGDNGNTVTFMLTDTQTIDSTTPVGIVTMLYFSADGKVAHVEHISTVRDAAGQPAYLRGVNQFELDLDYEWTKTKYGEVPTAEYNANTFHILLDDDGIADNDSFYYGSYNTWEDVVNAIYPWTGIGGASARHLKHYNILMTKDYTNSTASPNVLTNNNRGTITLDLNGHTLTNSAYLFRVYNKFDTYPPTIELKNGNVVQKGSSGIIVTQLSTKANGTQLSINLEELNISYSGGSAYVVSYYNGYDGYKCAVDINVTGCTVDTTGANGKVTLFNLADALDNCDVTLTLSGLTVKGTTAANTVLYTKNSDKILTKADENGNTVTLSLTEKATIDNIIGSSSGEYYIFGTPTEQDGRYVYTLKVTELERTAYGPIDSNAFPSSQYPFALFSHGDFVKAYTTYYSFLTDIQNSVLSESTLLVRSNWDTTDDGKSSAGLGKLKAPLTVDLNGFTVNRGSYHLFQLMGYGTDYSITVKNGTITSDTPPVVFNNNGDSTNKENVTARFESVTFVPNKSAGIVTSYGDGTGAGMTANVIFDNCTFNITKVSADTAILFNLLENKNANKSDITVTFNGGEFKANTYNQIFAAYNDARTDNSSPDNIRFGQYNGSRTRFTATSSTEAPAVDPVDTTGKDLVLSNIGTTDAPVYCLLTVTEYGIIPYTWEDGSAYPFILFVKGKDTAVFAGASWKEMLTKATTYLNSPDVQATILVRANASEGSADHPSGNIKGTLTVDLDGHTLTINKFLFKLNKTIKFDTNIEVKNGNLAFAGSAYLIYFGSSANTSNGAAGYACNVNFTNVKIGYASGATSLSWIRNMKSAGGLVTIGNLRFKNCVLDFKTNAPTGVITFAAVSADEHSHSANIVIDGGKIIYPSTASSLALFSLKDSTTAPDTFKFSNTATGKYTVISANAAPTDEYDTESGAVGRFIATETEAEYILYAHTHNHKAVVTAPTCTEKGYTTYTCDCGDTYTDNETEAKGHSFDNDCDTDCACGYVRAVTHDYTETDKNDTDHWKKCSVCGGIDESSKESHSFDNGCSDTECDCGYTRDVTHTYSNACDADCNYCDATRTPAEHIGGAATCTKKAVCSECGAEYGEFGDHEYKTEWLFDAEAHWHECSCGSKKDESRHTFSEWTEREGELIQSCECGHSVKDPSYQPDKSLDAGAIIGIIIGITAVVGAAGCCVYFFIIKKKK